MAIISDGMGTGGRAAVDGAMAASIMENLLKSGIGYQCALRLTNAALLAKSGDESLSTLDLVSVDLYTGHTVFYKAGAPVSFIRSNGACREIEASSFPAGILGDADFAKVEADLTPNDMIVLVSDGITACGTEWVCKMLEEWPGGDPGALASQLIEAAQKKRTDGHDDDITALVLVIESRTGTSTVKNA